MRHFFKNIHELISAAQQQAPSAKGTKVAYNNFFASRHHNVEWVGGIADITEYQNFVNCGYLPAVQNFDISAQTNEGNKSNFILSNCGQFGDVAKYLSGEPECMFDFSPQEINNYLTINISGVTPSTMKAKDIQEKCNAIFNAVNKLELSGTRCRILLTVCTKDRTTRKQDKDVDAQVLVKDYEDNFIPSYHGLILGHLTTIRGLIYAFLSLHSMSPSLGACREAEKEEGQILISYHHDTPEAIINKIK
jgi:hypothetical protein